MTTPKDLWIHNVVESLKQIASAEFQEKGWVKGEIHDYCTYTETIAGLLQEGLFDIFVDEKAREFGFSEDQIKKLEKLREALRIFDSKYSGWEDPQIIINDPEWLKIRTFAKDALKSLGIENYLDPSKEIIRYCLLDTINDISQPEYQKKFWIEQRRPSSNPYQEVMQKFFQAYKAQELINHYKDYEITENQVEKLIKLYKALKAYQEKMQDVQDLRKILDDPDWHQIQALAQEIVRVFEFKP